MMQRFNFAPRFPAHEAFDMCHPGYGKESDSVTVAESPIAGYFGTGSRVTKSAYEVPLKHGIPIDYDKEHH